MNRLKGSRALIIAFLLPFMLHQAIPDSVKWIWLTLVVLMALKRLGIINFGFAHSASGAGSSTALTPSAFSRGKAQCPELNQDMTHRGKIIAHGSAPYMFDETKRLNYYITLCSEQGEDKTVWGIDLKRVVEETPLTVGDTVSLEFVGREAVIVEEPVRNDQGHIVDHRKVSTHRHSWKAHVLSV